MHSVQKELDREFSLKVDFQYVQGPVYLRIECFFGFFSEKVIIVDP